MGTAICSGISQASNAVPLIQAGAREFYCGINVEAGCNSVGTRGLTRRGRHSENLKDLAELRKLVEITKEYNVPVCLLLNVSCTDQQMLMALDIAEKAVAIGIDRIVVKDMGLAMELNKRFPGIQLHASSTMNCGTVETVRLLKSLGFTRIILPRHFAHDQISKIEAEGVSTEILFYRERCFFDDGHCNFHHHTGESPVGHLKLIRGERFQALKSAIPPPIHILLQRIMFRFFPSPLACRQRYHPDKLSNNKNAVKQTLQVLREHHHVWTCGACALPGLVRAGCRYLKVVNRTLEPKMQVESVKFVRRIVELFENTPDEGEFFKESRKLYQRTHLVANCEKYCYYPKGEM